MLSEIKDKPQLGEIRRAQEIGRGGTIKFQWHACPQCHKERWVQINKGEPRYSLCLNCSNLCNKDVRGRQWLTRYANGFPEKWRGENNWNWQGGKTRHRDGYVLIKINPDDFFFAMANPSTWYVLEHRLVMAHHIKRCLHSWEIVHHINHDRADNRIENLQLVGIDKHNQMTQMENRIKRLEARVIQLEAENSLLKSRVGEVC